MNRPHGLKYKKRGGSLRANRLEQLRKTGIRESVRTAQDNAERERIEQEQRRTESEHRSDARHQAEMRERDRIRVEAERARRRNLKEEREEQIRRDQERIAGMKARGQAVTSNIKKNQNLMRQVGVTGNSSKHHSMIGLLNQRGRVRRRVH
jgi:hypothetical protein